MQNISFASFKAQIEENRILRIRKCSEKLNITGKENTRTSDWHNPYQFLYSIFGRVCIFIQTVQLL